MPECVSKWGDLLSPTHSPTVNVQCSLEAITGCRIPAGSRPIWGIQTTGPYRYRLRTTSGGHRRIRATQRDVFGGPDMAVRVGPDFARLRDQNGPIKIGFGAIVNDEMSESFALRCVHWNGWVKLKHRNLSSCRARCFRAREVFANRAVRQ